MKRLRRLERRRHPDIAQRRDDRFPPSSQGWLRVHARDDPNTGLIAWPDFSGLLSGLVEDAVGSGRRLGLAIGDVDNLKEYVERAKAADAESFGHLAGNALMARLGTVSRNWMFERGPEHACLATFGGDEIVLLADSVDDAVFGDHVHDLRDTLCDVLPRTVSFATAVLTPEHVPGTVTGDQWWREFTIHALGAVERSLFHHKHVRRDDPAAIPDGFVVPVAISRRADAATDVTA